MPEFNVEVTVRMELGCVMTVKAKNEEAATEKAQKMIDDGWFGIANWTADKRTADEDWTEASQEAELDSVSEC